MFVKLALRNMKRQLGNYMIYFVTVMLSVALLFAVDNMIASPQITKITDSSDIKAVFVFVQVLSVLVTVFVLTLATGFLVKLRAKEFGLYLTVGMTRKNIITLFVLEELLLSVLALGAGILFGLFLYQGGMALLCGLMEIEVEFSGYSPSGFLVTVLVSLGMFAASSLGAAVYLRKTNLTALLSGTSSYKKTKRPGLWCAFAVLSLAGFVLSGCGEYRALARSMTDGSASSAPVMGYFVLLVLTCFFLHFCLAKGLFGVLGKNRRLCAVGTNQFLYRQLLHKSNVNAVLIGTLSVLFFGAVIFCNMGMTEKVSNQARLDQEFPFDIAYDSSYQVSEEQIPIDKAEEIIGQYAVISEKIEYPVYTTGDNVLGKNFEECQYDGYEDRMMKLSDFNRLLAALGMEPVSLADEYLIVDENNFLTDSDFTEKKLTLNGKEYKNAGVSHRYPCFLYRSFYAVVPDETIDAGWDASLRIVYRLEEPHFEGAFELEEELLYPCYTMEDGAILMDSQFWIRESNRLYYNAMTGALGVGFLFIAVIFVCMSLAILSLKTLSSVGEDRPRYAILSRLGADRETLSGTLLWQDLAFFALPFVLPFLTMVPAAGICHAVLTLQGFPELKSTVYLTAAVSAAVMLIVYCLYFALTVGNAKRQVL